MKRNERLKKAFEYAKSRGVVHTQKDAAQLMGATPQNFSGALNGDPRCLTDKFLQRFNEAFGNVFNLDWLLTGEGEMLMNGERPTPAPKDASRCYDVLTIQGGTGHGSPLDRITDNDVVVGHMMAPDLPVGDDIIYIKVRGNSMVNRNDPAHSIPDGAWVGIRRATSSVIRWGEVYAIMTTDGAVVKKVLQSDSPDTLRLASYNVEDGYMPFDLPVSEIIQPLYNVVGVVTASRWV